LLESLVLGLLVADVLANGRLVASDRRYEVSPCPEVLPNEVPFLVEERPANVDRALPLMYPMTCATEYFGGIEIDMCTWSGIR
jgi:hypothetical protein